MIKAIIGKKVGMTQIYTPDGKVHPVTVIDVSDVKVSKHISIAADQVTHVELGAGSVKRPNKADQGNYSQLGSVPVFKTVFRIDNKPNTDSEILPIGTVLSADIFAVGDKVDITAVTKAKGFQGVMKRLGYSGGIKTHGGPTGKMRHGGSLGTNTTPGRVFKGKGMPGRMGGNTKTVQNLNIVQVEPEHNLIAIEGALPGNNGSYVQIVSTSHRRNG